MEEQEQSPYDQTLFNTLFRIEELHFWFRARRKIVGDLISQITPDFPQGFRMIEIGCGTGNLLKAMNESSKTGNTYGSDIYWQGLHFSSQQTQANLFQGDLLHLPIGDRQFHLVGLFDVLEHIQNDSGALRQMNRILTNGGFLLVNVPAHQKLWSYFDLISHHQRRYETSDLQKILEQAGFALDYITEYMQVLYPFAYLRTKLTRRMRNAKPDNQLSHIDVLEADVSVLPVINEIAYFLLSLEFNKIRQRQHIQRGTSILVIARKVRDM
jgi:ubiquinone/menaquinone biosynthesis C-methylase UbiE